MIAITDPAVENEDKLVLSGRPKRLPDGTEIDPDCYCDFDPTDARRNGSEPYHITRRRGFLYAVKEVRELAKRNLFMRENKAEWAKLDPSEITDEIIAAAQAAIDSWTQVRDKLIRIRREHEAAQAAASIQDQSEEEEPKVLH